MKKKITLLNMITTLAAQLITILSGFIIPKLILTTFGSEVNGLVSSINQFLNYINLVEGGISGVIIASLYSPIYKKDNKKISSIIKTADNFYKKISFLFIVYILILALLYPILFKSSFSFSFVSSLVIILSLTLFIRYMFSLTMRNLLVADKKVYIISTVQSIITIINIFIAYLSIKIYPSIHIFKLCTGLMFILQPVIFRRYISKNYNLDLNVKEEKSILKSRWDGFAINIATFIHNSTDIAILTIFTNLNVVSIYSTYVLISSGLKQIFESLTNGINPAIGQAYAKNNLVELNKKMDMYEYFVIVTTFFVFSVAAFLITPFVMIYTKNINDADYYRPLFGILILISEGLYVLNIPHLNLAYSANKFKQLTVPAFIEATINIVVSMILVKKYGLIGVAIGTIVAMTYNLIFYASFMKKIIPNRKSVEFYKKICLFILSAIIGSVICSMFGKINYNYSSWIFSAIIYSCIFGIIYSVISLLFFRKELCYLKKYLFKEKIKH